MSEFELEAIPEQAAPRRGRRILRRVLRGLLVAIAALVALGAALYFFGGMWGRTQEMRTAYAALVDAGKAEPLHGRFVIPVPGCVCHSEDPVSQAQHSTWRISECAECH